MASIKLPNEQPRRTLDDIFSGPDEFGLLNVQPKARNLGRIEEGRFEEINIFIDQNGREPTPEGNLAEKSLARRIASIRSNKEFLTALKHIDRHNLLPEVTAGNADYKFQLQRAAEEPAAYEIEQSATSIDDIINSSVFASLTSGDSGIFDIKNVPDLKDRQQPEEIAERKRCQDFYKFERKFSEMLDAIKNGSAEMTRFTKSEQIRLGDFYILKGMLCFVAEIGKERYDTEGRFDPRLRLIFDNGTESNMLSRSLSKRLWEDKSGKRIIPDVNSVIDSFHDIGPNDKPTGYIYFVTSLSDNPALKSVPNLLKIGYTEQSVEKRIRNAEKDTTFLEAPVKVLATYDCFNLNPQKFETLIHGVLHAQRLQMALTGKDGKSYHPREWFSVDIETAKQVVKRIIDGSIVEYRMNNTTGKLISKR